MSIFIFLCLARLTKLMADFKEKRGRINFYFRTKTIQNFIKSWGKHLEVIVYITKKFTIGIIVVGQMMMSRSQDKQAEILKMSLVFGKQLWIIFHIMLWDCRLPLSVSCESSGRRQSHNIEHALKKFPESLSKQQLFHIRHIPPFYVLVFLRRK